jgi:hypothetical protein
MQTDTVTTAPPTYAAYPTNGGPLFDAEGKAVARPKVGLWFDEPKFNGWSLLCHVPSGRLFNGHELTRSTIEDKFTDALELLRNTLPHFNWLHVEGLNNRHDIGKGALVVLDLVVPDLTYGQRRAALEKALPSLPIDFTLLSGFPRISLAPIVADNTSAALELAAWDYLKAVNLEVGCDFYEGMVAKKQGGSLYPMQLRKPKDKCRTWVKHRWNW